MNKLTIITIVSALVTMAKADCFSTSMGYPCCEGCEDIYEDEDGKWGVENNEWCGIDDAKCNPQDTSCWSLPDYPCCVGNTVIYTDESGDWGVENDEWCGIVKNNGSSSATKKTTTTTKKSSATSSSSGDVLYPEYEKLECTPPDEFSYGQCCHGEDIEAYGKCGGKDWTGSTCCMVGTSCKEVNEWVSLCEPDPTAPIRPATFPVGVHGKPWCKPPNCVVTENQGGYNWGYDVVSDSGCEIPEYECYDYIHKTWGPQEYPVGTEKGITTRYYDCCKPSCSWPGKADVTQPVRQCAKDGKTLLTDFSAPSACQTDVEGISHMCEEQQPWAVSDVLSYGFAAAALPGGNLNPAVLATLLPSLTHQLEVSKLLSKLLTLVLMLVPTNSIFKFQVVVSVFSMLVLTCTVYQLVLTVGVRSMVVLTRLKIVIPSQKLYKLVAVGDSNSY